VKHDFLDRYSSLDSPVHRLDPRAKIVIFLGTVVLAVSTPPQEWRAFLAYLALLIMLAAASQVPARHLLRRILMVLPLVLAASIFIPFVKRDGPSGYSLGPVAVSPSGLLIFWNVLVKAALAVFSMSLLTSTTPFPKLLAGLEQLRVPRILVMLASFTYRYLFVLVDEAERMERAVASRGWRGRWIWQARVIGQIIGMLFLRSYERAERVYVAMASRGFEGRALGTGALRLQGTDYLFMGAALGFLILVRATCGW
jgi:cobalt/nickel transport system permease protein